MHEEPVSLDSVGVRLVGMLHQPDRPPVARIVFAYPLFEERKSAHRILVETARTLSRAGMAVLRVDYRGCGDSDGAFDAFSAPDWSADLRAAAAWLESRFPDCPSGLLGLRLGASLALKAAEEGPAVDFAILWEPVPKGREYLEQELRRKLMKEMMTFGKSRVSRDALIDSLAAGQSIDFDGYAVTPALHRDLGSVDLSALKRLPSRILTLSIGSAERPAPIVVQLAEGWNAGGAKVDVEAVREQPFWNLVGLVPCPALIGRTAAWISAAVSAPAAGA